MNILSKGSRHFFLSNYDFNTTSYDGCLSDDLFFFILEQYMICDTYGVKSPSFQSSSVLYIIIVINGSLQELVMQGLEER